MNSKKILFFTNLFRSGLVDVWFKGIAYALVTSAFAYMYFNEGIQLALFVFLFSYLFTGIQVIQGTREPYEKLKTIYVKKQHNRVLAFVFETLFLYVRLQIIITPLIVMAWASAQGRLPI